MDRIVVGIDTSPASVRALAWARAQAFRTDASLELVHVYAPHELTLPIFTPSEFVAPRASFDLWRELQVVERDVVHERATVAASYRAAADRVVVAAVAAVGGLGSLVVRRTVVADRHPSRVLLNRASGASLLVLGATPGGHPAGILVGSIADACTRNAPCPVVIVPVGAALTEQPYAAAFAHAN